MVYSVMQRFPKSTSILSGLAFLLTSLTALGHAHLHSSVPAERSTVNSAPSNIVLNLSEPARLTVASISKNGEPKHKLEALPNRPAQRVEIPLPHLTPGRYEISWRALSDDGHVMPGVLHFTLAPQPAAIQPNHP